MVLNCQARGKWIQAHGWQFVFVCCICSCICNIHCSRIQCKLGKNWRPVWPLPVYLYLYLYFYLYLQYSALLSTMQAWEELNQACVIIAGVFVFVFVFAFKIFSAVEYNASLGRMESGLCDHHWCISATVYLPLEHNCSVLSILMWILR